MRARGSEGLSGGRGGPDETMLSIPGEANPDASGVNEEVEFTSSKSLHPSVPLNAGLLGCHENRLRRGACG
jgi:hypothetical protein